MGLCPYKSCFREILSPFHYVRIQQKGASYELGESPNFLLGHPTSRTVKNKFPTLQTFTSGFNWLNLAKLSCNKTLRVMVAVVISLYGRVEQRKDCCGEEVPILFPVPYSNASLTLFIFLPRIRLKELHSSFEWKYVRLS